MADIRNYINPHPRFAASGQIDRLGPGENYIENRTGRAIVGLIKSIRRELHSIVQVDELFLLAPIHEKPRKRKAALADRIEKIRAAGGTVRERSSGLKSNRRGFERAIVRALEMISNGGRGAPGRSRKGKPPIVLSEHEMAIVEAVWFSRKYANDDERLVAIEKRIGKKLGRTWVWNKMNSPHKRDETE